MPQCNLLRKAIIPEFYFNGLLAYCQGAVWGLCGGNSWFGGLAHSEGPEILENAGLCFFYPSSLRAKFHPQRSNAELGGVCACSAQPMPTIPLQVYSSFGESAFLQSAGRS